MKISNPWPHRPMTRITCRTPNGEVVCTSSTRGPLDVPDDTVEALLEPVANGRPGAAVIGQPQIWSNRFGLLNLEDHAKKVEIEKEEADMKARKQKEKEEREEKARKAKIEKERRPLKPKVGDIDVKPPKKD